MATLIIGTIEIPTESLLEFNQSYIARSAIDFRRAADGSGYLRSAWSGKLSTTISATGWVPGIDEIDRGTTQVISCAMPRAVSSATTTVTIPAARRTDEDPIGFAVVNEFLIETPITNLAAINAESTNDATLTAVAGASGYRVHYFPRITAAVVSNTIDGGSSGSFSWSIEAEEV
jgi:hypothetical protein